MSTVPEVIAARRMGIRCLGISVVTNMAAGVGSGLDHGEVLAVGAEPRRLTALVRELLPRLRRRRPSGDTGAMPGPRSCATCPRSTGCSRTSALWTPHELAVDVARSALERAREEIRAGREPEPLVDSVLEKLARARRPSLRRVLNATGVLVHTNLGRAPLAEAALERVAEVGPDTRTSSTTSSGASAARARIISDRCSSVSRARRPRSWSTTTRPRCCSRSPPSPKAVRSWSRAGSSSRSATGFVSRTCSRVRERGSSSRTTNRTRAGDYERAIGPETALLLRVHQSNFRVVGFTERPGLEELGRVAEASWPPSRRRPRLRRARRGRRRADAAREPVRGRMSSASRETSSSADRRRDRRRASGAGGAAATRFSARCAPTSSSRRARGTLSVADPATRDRIPVLRMLHEPVEKVRARAERLASLVGGDVEESVARVGGGALPLAELPSAACAVEEPRRAAPSGRAAGDRGRPRRPHTPRLPRTLSEDEIDEVAVAVASARRERVCHAADRRHRGAHRPRKTWLVRALTGKDTDRLPEEQRRGISIDLGYAPLELPDGRRLSVVDVPGHERSVRTMVAGATGIDLFLLVVDAGEALVLRPTSISRSAAPFLERGVVAVTKADAVDEETLELAPRSLEGARSGLRGRGGERAHRRRNRRTSRGARACGGRSRPGEGGGAYPALRGSLLHPAQDRTVTDGDALVGNGRRRRRSRSPAFRKGGARAQRSASTIATSSRQTPGSGSR